ncbi:MAG: hypothetical protein Q4D38_08080 [Planctomycetia bacterium]|nr:hypothetical protein [Planctomycetia bacterium]
MQKPNFNWKWGDTCPITIQASKNDVIHAGDLIWMNTSNKGAPASAFAYDTSESKTQENFVSKFLGVAMQDSGAGDERFIRVATTGTFEFDDVSADISAQNLGTFMGPVLNSDDSYLENRSLAVVTGSRLAIGRITHTESVPTGKALVAIISTVMRGGAAGSDPTLISESNS